MSIETAGDRALVRAGPGEWFNQPHNRRWDMGEDVLPLPPSPWHVEVERASEVHGIAHLTVDMSQMDWLVGQDIGFLLDLQRRLEPRGVHLCLLATPRVVRAIGGLGLPLEIHTPKG